MIFLENTWLGFSSKDGSITLEYAFNSINEAKLYIANLVNDFDCSSRLQLAQPKFYFIVETNDPDKWEIQTNHGKNKDTTLLKFDRNLKNCT
jgi:hypothetical protein